MDEGIEQLKELADSFRKMSSKLVLLRLINQAKTEYDKCNFEDSRKKLLEAYKLDNKNAVVLRGLGCIKQFENKWNSAIRYFNLALEYSDNKEIEYTLLGMAYYLQNQLDDAVKYFNLAIDTNDNYTQAYEGRNQAMLENHLKLIDLQDALKKYF